MKKYLKFAAMIMVVLMISAFLPAGFGYFEVLNVNIGYASSFWIEQDAATSGGTVQRHIDISSPWSGGYIYEDSTMVGRVEISESFSMSNIGPLPTKGSGSGSEVNSASSSASNNKSDQKQSTASEEKTTPDLELVLGVSIYANLTWLDLF